MACFHPISAFQLDTGEIVFIERGAVKRPLSLPCGRCTGCRIDRAKQWSIRCTHEAQMHEFNSFVTLTYNDDSLPHDWSLNYRDYQLFMKRLRLKFQGARFYMCGEYGEKNSRPHYHACLFGVHFADREPWRRNAQGDTLYRSDLLEKLWGLGHCEIGNVTMQSAGYVARYIMKKRLGNNTLDHYSIVDPDTGELHHRSPEFSRMSLKPGIGYSWFQKYKSDVFPLDRVVINGRDFKPPKYYKQLLDAHTGTMSDDIEYDRYMKAIQLIDDNTPERLAVREECLISKTKAMTRSI